ncbi:hypothetical protein HAX54_041351, partial [Datura stramonium]|nr:hypothetical protein [Datura stramonium]
MTTSHTYFTKAQQPAEPPTKSLDVEAKHIAENKSMYHVIKTLKTQMNSLLVTGRHRRTRSPSISIDDEISNDDEECVEQAPS